ncbi:polysaccharide deacetylase family protein [Pseudomonas sp. S 311-6]|nr:polysaccharide deacetylase family protein [Kerstersia gyiorum]MCO7642743.1 polysaccharide deacetylase family protein [Pseudomonas sp. S 311-6]MCR4157753.1 polysaccharide deacetylase family protein [Kerstersia gyiorum]QBR42070.1 hypothetical protein EHF36_16615 [Kerstersia gyiorum]
MSFSQAVPVLMYHHVSPVTQGLSTSPRLFASQMRWLRKHGWQTLTAEQLRGFLEEGRPVPRRSVVLTFDDGYLDNWQYAHPVLKEYGFSAIMFVVTDWIGQGPARPCADIEAIRRDRLASFESWSHAECKRLIAGGEADRVIVRQSEVDEMRRAGTFEFHAHTHTHTRWDKVCCSVEEKRTGLAQDLRAQRAYFEAHMGGATEQLCWPQGYFDDDYLDVARQAGFSVFYTTKSHGYNTAGSGTASIWRVSVRNRGGLLFGLRLRLAMPDFLGRLYNRWKA